MLHAEWFVICIQQYDAQHCHGKQGRQTVPIMMILVDSVLTLMA
jgi:hypothetical protein